ncbi:MAG: PadR family transcriptional regulator [Gaiellaceae bacterium]
MRAPTYFTLAALLDGPLHGYGIIKRAEQLSEGAVQMTAGTLYGALDRLNREGLVIEQGQEIVAGRARRYYRLTDEGRSALDIEAERMSKAAAVVQKPEGVAASTARRRPVKAQPRLA